MAGRLGGPRRPFRGRRVLLGVSGGIAAFKAITLARELTQAGAQVDVVLTEGAREFVRALSFEALTGRPVYMDAWIRGDPLLHIRLAREADAVVIAPATANLLARAAAGMADDLLTCVLLATAAPVLICPAMNDRMYGHPQTQANLLRLQEIGYRIAGPDVGPLAWGEGEGPGRLLEPETIVDHAGALLSGGGPLAGKRVVVTAGPTREPLDPVRYIGNRSSGRMGYALAAAAWQRGGEVLLISGPTERPLPTGVRACRVGTAAEMRHEVAAALPAADVLIMAAAIADFRPAAAAADKLKKEAGTPRSIVLQPTEDVLASTRALRGDGLVSVGFALETCDVVANGRRKLADKGLDLLVANDANEEGAGFEVSTNRVTLLAPGVDDEALPLLLKEEVAERILDRVERILGERREAF